MNNTKLILLAAGIIGIVVVIGILFMLYQPNTHSTKHQAHNNLTENYKSTLAPNHNHDSIARAIETFAISDADFNNFLKTASETNGITIEQRKQLLAKLGCQSAIDQNMEGYRSLESGATFKIEKVSKTGELDKYIIHAADNLVLSVDPATGRLSRTVKNTNDIKQLFTKEIVKDAAGADTNINIFTKELASGAKLALQYEHESLSLRPLDPANNPWRGQQFILDANLKGDLLDNAAMVLGYRLAPSVSGSDLQNAGTVAMCGAGSGSSTPLPTTGTNSALGALTQQQLNEAVAAAMANINAYNNTSGGSQPGTQNNPFANKALRINLNLGGLGTQSSTTPTIPGRVAFTDIPRNHTQIEGFNTMAGSEYQTGQVRDLIRAWDATQPGANNNDSLSGLPAAAKSLRDTLRGRSMVSCPKIDRSQYYTERQLAQCAGCTPDPYLRGQLTSA